MLSSEEREKMINDCEDKLDEAITLLHDCVKHIQKDLQQLKKKADKVKHESEIFSTNSTEAHPEKKLNLSELNDSIQETVGQLKDYFCLYRNYARMVENGFKQHGQNAAESITEQLTQ